MSAVTGVESLLEMDFTLIKQGDKHRLVKGFVLWFTHQHEH